MRNGRRILGREGVDFFIICYLDCGCDVVKSMIVVVDCGLVVLYVFVLMLMLTLTF